MQAREPRDLDGNGDGRGPVLAGSKPMNEGYGEDRAWTRVPRSKEEAQATYDRLSRWYDLLAAGSEGPHVEAGIRMLDVQEGERVLEIGFGTGRGLVALARDAGTSGRVYGLDISSGMAREARRRLEEAGVDDRVRLMLGDGARLPLAGGSIDAVFMSFTLELFDTPRLQPVLNGCARVLRPDGRLCVVSLAKRGRGSATVRLYEWVHEMVPRWVDCRPIPVREVLERVGFEIVEIDRRSMWTLPVYVLLARSADGAGTVTAAPKHADKRSRMEGDHDDE